VPFGVLLVELNCQLPTKYCALVFKICFCESPAFKNRFGLLVVSFQFRADGTLF
jgi:hypothetical protein